MVKTIINKEIFAERLKALMQECDETIYSLAEVLHLSAPTISRYSNAEMSPKITTIEVLANHFGVNPPWLMGFNTEKYVSKSEEPSSEYDVITMAAHKVGHDGDLTEEEREDIELAIQIALAKHKNRR